MEIFPGGLPSLVAPFLDHLWQSTAFGGLMALAALALRKNRAAVRFWLWLAASVKFLVPCALLMELGELVRKYPALATTPQIESWTAIQDAGQAVFAPSSAIVTATTPAQSHADIWFAVIAAVWVCGFLFVAVRWLRQWQAVRSLVRKAEPIDLGLPIPSVSAPARLEPGVFGIFRPVLFLPEGITERLTPEQMQALFAHEICHVRRRDNLWAAVHVLVEAVFWFHPLVWWLGARMIAEREAACDEAVLKSGAEAETYATSVLGSLPDLCCFADAGDCRNHRRGFQAACHHDCQPELRPQLEPWQKAGAGVKRAGRLGSAHCLWLGQPASGSSFRQGRDCPAAEV